MLKIMGKITGVDQVVVNEVNLILKLQMNILNRKLFSSTICPLY